MTDLYAALFAAGVALAAAAAFWSCFDCLFRLRDPLRAGLRRLGEKQTKITLLSESHRGVVVGSIAGLVLMLLLGHGSAKLPQLCLFGSSVGAGLGWFVQRGARETARLRKIRQVAALYEAVDFYTRAGYTVRQSLALAVVLAPGLKRAVERCLAAWPSGPVRALEKMAAEIDVPEASLLASVLAYAEEGGVQFGRSAIEEESRNLEALRQTLAEIRIVAKPVYFAVYRGLPLLAVGGVIVGPLVYRLIKLLGVFFGSGLW